MRLIYFTVIGDIVSSRSIRERDAFQRHLQTALNTLNTLRRPHRSYQIVAGDQVEAVYLAGTHILLDLWQLACQIRPYSIRFAVGIGELSTLASDAAGSDGPAFHRARDHVEKLKRTRDLCGITTSEPIDVGVEDAAARLMFHAAHTWRPMRWTILDRLIRDEGAIRIADELGLTPAAVYKNIHEGGLARTVSLSLAIGESLHRKGGY